MIILSTSAAIGIVCIAVLITTLFSRLWYVEGRLSELTKPRYNSTAGQQIIRESEEIRTGLGTLNYHLERAASLEEVAKSHRIEAQAISRRIQTEAEITQERMTSGRD